MKNPFPHPKYSCTILNGEDGYPQNFPIPGANTPLGAKRVVDKYVIGYDENTGIAIFQVEYPGEDKLIAGKWGSKGKWDNHR